MIYQSFDKRSTQSQREIMDAKCHTQIHQVTCFRFKDCSQGGSGLSVFRRLFHRLKISTSNINWVRTKLGPLNIQRMPSEKNTWHIRHGQFGRRNNRNRVYCFVNDRISGSIATSMEVFNFAIDLLNLMTFCFHPVIVNVAPFPKEVSATLSIKSDGTQRSSLHLRHGGLCRGLKLLGR